MDSRRTGIMLRRLALRPARNGRPTARRALALLPLLTAVLLGVYAQRDGAAAAAARPSAEADAEDAIAVELLQPGAAPLTPLRYQQALPPRTFRLVVQSGIYVMRGILQGEDSYLPTVVTSWDNIGEPPSAGQEPCARWRLASAEVLPEKDKKKVPATVVDATRRVVSALVGREVTTCVGNRGGLRLTMPEPADASQRQLLDIFAQAFELEFTVPLPREPVGVGAKWRVRRPLPLAVADATYQLDYELKNVAAKGIETAVTIAFSGEPRRVKPTDPSVALRTPVVVDQIEGEGHGELYSMLGEMTPMRMDLSFEAVLSLTPSTSDGAPTEEERRHGYRLVYRTREMMQAAQLGRLTWSEDRGRRKDP
jgi:hypothetical protein